MTKNFGEALIELLKTDSRFVDDEGELVKAAVIDRAWKIDRDLVKLLLADPGIKGKFFDEIEGHWIFNINTFIEYLSDKNFLANSYTRFRNKIGLNIGGKFLRERGEVSLVWPYKDCVLEGGQTREEEKRKEIFFNEILAQDEIDRLFDPKVLTNWKRYTVDGEQKVTEIRRDENGTIRENLTMPNPGLDQDQPAGIAPGKDLLRYGNPLAEARRPAGPLPRQDRPYNAVYRVRLNQPRIPQNLY